MKLTVALTSYNHEQYIEAALESILAQQPNCDYEILICDDFSKDKTVEILKGYEARYPNLIRVYTNDQNIGYIRNFEKSLYLGSGELVAIFDGDDLMRPGKLVRQLKYMDEHPDYVLLGHKARVFESETDKTLRFIVPPGGGKREYYTLEDFIQHGSILSNSSKVFRRSALPPDGIDRNIRHIADWYITMKIAERGKTGFINEVYTDYRVHRASIMKKINGSEHYDDKLYILNKIERENPGKYSHLFAKQIAYAHMIKGMHLQQQQKKGEARKELFKAILKHPTFSPAPYVRLFSSFVKK